MQNDQSSLHRWTWAIALLLAILLLWMLLTGHGPSNTCCSQTESIVPTVATTEPFRFTATLGEINTSGDTSHIDWLTQTDSLRALLNRGEDLWLEGNEKTATLTGFVESETTKNKIAEEIQALLGNGILLDNQLAVRAYDEPVAAPAMPSSAKLYFETGKATLPANTNSTLSLVVEWLNTHPESRAVLSGYHDTRGDRAFNEELAKNRAKAVREALKAAGVDESRIEMRKPEIVEGGSDLQEARRVEVSVE